MMATQWKTVLETNCWLAISFSLLILLKGFPCAEGKGPPIKKSLECYQCSGPQRCSKDIKGMRSWALESENGDKPVCFITFQFFEKGDPKVISRYGGFDRKMSELQASCKLEAGGKQERCICLEDKCNGQIPGCSLRADPKKVPGC